MATKLIESQANEPDFDINRHVVALIHEAPFYAMISQNVRKISNDDVGTAGMAYNIANEEFTLLYSPLFFGGGTRTYERSDGTKYTRTYMPLSNWEIRNVLIHEFNHLVFGHLTGRRLKPSLFWNYSTDCSINSLIAITNKSVSATGHGPLPYGVLIPGQMIEELPQNISQFNERELAHHTALSKFVAALPQNKTSEFYMQEFMTKFSSDESNCEDGEGEFPGSGGGGGDSHVMWDDIPEEYREAIMNAAKSIVEKAVRSADSSSSGWGNIPMEIREEIRRSVNNVIDWKLVLKQFVGTLMRGERATSIKRINRKYPKVHPGLVKGHVAKLLIAIDMSGSVGDDMLESFFGTLSTLSKKVDIDILPFDCSMSEDELFTWKRGTVPELKRVRCGGTDFNVPTRFVNDPKNRGRWDGYLIMTDGQAYKPEATRTKRGWVLGSGTKLNFDSQELQIFMSKNQKVTGAWR